MFGATFHTLFLPDKIVQYLWHYMCRYPLAPKKQTNIS